MTVSTTDHQTTSLGQVFTPPDLSRFIARCISFMQPSLQTVLDPAIGYGVLVKHLLDEVGPLEVTGVDVDPSILDTSRRLLSRHCHKLTLLNTDFLLLENKEFPHGMYDVVVSNPPYVSARATPFLNTYIDRYRLNNHTLPRSTNLYMFFMLRCLELLRKDGLLVFIIPATFLGATYTSLLREHLLDHYRLEGLVHIPLRDHNHVFSDSIVSALVLFVRNSSPNGARIPVSKVYEWSDLENLPRNLATHTPSCNVDLKHNHEFAHPFGWGPAFTPIGLPETVLTPLAELFEVTRGVETGCDQFFTLNQTMVSQWQIPESVLKPIVTRARFVTRWSFSSDDFDLLAQANERVYLVVGSKHDLPSQYLEHGISQGVHQRSVPSLRNEWYRAEEQQPSPIIMKRMYRGNPLLTLNDAQVLALTSFIGFRPRNGSRLLSKAFLAYCLSEYGRRAWTGVALDCGKGLRKIELAAARSVRIPNFTDLPVCWTRSLASLFDRWVHHPQDELLEQINQMVAEV